MTQKFFLFFLFAININLNSQTDTLITLEGNKVPVIIKEITMKDVIYKIANKEDLPLFHYPRKNLDLIIFKDGTEMIPSNFSVNPLDKKLKLKSIGIVYFIPTKLFQNHIGIAYEYIFKSHLIGLKVPFSLAFTDASKINLEGAYLHNSDNKRFFTTGLDINIYPFKLGKIKYFTGLGFQYARFAYKYYQRWATNPFYTTTNGTGNHFSFVINNGFLAQPTKHIVFGSSLGLGIHYESGIYYNDRNIRVNATIQVGYKF